MSSFSQRIGKLMAEFNEPEDMLMRDWTQFYAGLTEVSRLYREKSLTAEAIAEQKQHMESRLQLLFEQCANVYLEGDRPSP